METLAKNIGPDQATNGLNAFANETVKDRREIAMIIAALSHTAAQDHTAGQQHSAAHCEVSNEFGERDS